MNAQLTMKLDSNTFIPKNESLEGTLQDSFTEFCTQLGFPVGVANIMDLDQDGFAEARANSFGASDSSVILGVAYSSSRVEMKTLSQLVDEKVNNVFDEEIGKLASVRKGKELEDMIIHKIETILNATIIKPDHMFINGKGLATNFDGIIFEQLPDEEHTIIEDYMPIPMEIKVCSFFGRKNYDWNKGLSEFAGDFNLNVLDKPRLRLMNDIEISEYVELQADYYGIPKYYYTQLQQQMLFTDASHGYLAVMDDINWTIYFYKILRDAYVINTLNLRSEQAYTQLIARKGLKDKVASQFIEEQSNGINNEDL